MRPVFGSTPPQKLIGAVRTSAGRRRRPGREFGLDLVMFALPKTGRPATALSTQSASDP
jgi:hypothetical protein